jgi:galactan 5-O-arabinofuranosyltransferase
VTITEEIPVTTTDPDGGDSSPAAGSLLADPVDAAAAPPLTARRIGRGAAELVVAAIVAAVVSLPLQFVIDRLHVPRPSYVTVAMTSLVAVVLLAGALWAVTRNRFPRWVTVASWAGLSALNTAVLAFMLQGTKFYLGGVSSDQSFRTEYFTRLTDSATVHDFAFAGLPSYYPSGWFWLGGRFANLMGLAGWAAYKPFAILTIAVAGALAYSAWSLVTSRRVAVLMALATSTVGVATWAAYEPYAWLLGALIPPLAAVAWHYLTRLDGFHPDRVKQVSRWAPGVLLGVYIGLLALLYTLLFLFFTMVVVLTALVGLAMCRKAGHRDWAPVRRAIARVLLVGVVALPIMLVHWGPYLLQAIGATKQSAASAILPEFGAQFPVPISLSDFVGILSLAGLVWLVIRVRDSVVVRSLALVLAAGYLWYFVSMLGIPFMMTLLPYKIELVMDTVLRCAGVLAVLDGARWLAGLLAATRWRRTTLVSVLVVGMLGSVGILQSAADSLSPLPDQAFSDYYPNGDPALGKRDPKENGAYNQQLHDAIAALTGKPEHDSVVLSDYQDFLSFWPYYSFQTSIIEYANPLADFYNRRAAIQDWAKAGSPGQLSQELRTYPGGHAPDVFVFTRAANGLHLTVTRNVFPAYPQIESTTVVFPRSLFASPDFVTRDVGPFTVVVRR